MAFSGERVCFVVVCVCFAAAFSRENKEKGEDQSIKLKDKAEDICKLPPSSGPCYGYFEMWYYNTTTKRCEQFVYGGCAGNSNRFENKEKCEVKCSKETLTPQSPCAKELAKIKPGLIGAFTPQCDKDGYYMHKQCWGSVGSCWCVDRLGNKIAPVEERPDSRVELDCEYPCLKAYKKALSPAVLLRGEALPLQLNQYIPTCDHEGYYNPKQCHIATGKCWCVNRLGAKLPGTETTTDTDKLNCG